MNPLEFIEELHWRAYKFQFRVRSRPQCARSLILLEKWGVKTFISSMQSGLLGTISSHSGVKLVSFHHLFQS